MWIYATLKIKRNENKQINKTKKDPEKKKEKKMHENQTDNKKKSNQIPKFLLPAISRMLKHWAKIILNRDVLT